MAGINKAQVFNAADAISAAGQAPTVASIRTKLGTGSYTTITGMLREWKEQANTQDNNEAFDVPEEITQALGRAAEIVWKAAQDHFKHEIATVKKEAEKHTGQAQAQAAEAFEEINRLESFIEKLTDDAAAHETQADLLRTQMEEFRAEKNALAATLKAADARIKEQGDLLRRMIPEAKPKAEAKTKAPAKAKPAKATSDELAGQA